MYDVASRSVESAMSRALGPFGELNDPDEMPDTAWEIVSSFTPTDRAASMAASTEAFPARLADSARFLA